MIVSPLGALYEPPTPEEQFECDVVQWLFALAEQQEKIT